MAKNMTKRLNLQKDLEDAIAAGKSQQSIDRLRAKIASLEDAEKKLLNTRKQNEAALKKLEEKSMSYGLILDGVLGKMEKLTLPLTALAGVGVAAWSTQEKALTSMNAALAAGGLDVEAYGKKFEKIASDIQKFTVIGDEAILQNEQFALSLGIPAEKMEEAQRAAVSLSRAFKKDLGESTRIIARAMSGDFEALNEVIPAIKMTQNPTEKLAILNKELARSWEIAKAETETTAGALQQTKNALGDTAEEVGKVLAPIVISAANTIKTLAEWFNKLNDTSKAFIVSIGATAVALPKIVRSFQAMNAAMVALGVSTKGATVAMKGFRAALVTSGVGVAVVALGYGLEKLIGWLDSSKESMEESGKESEKFAGVTADLDKAIAKAGASVKSLSDALLELNKTQEDRRVSLLKGEEREKYFALELKNSTEALQKYEILLNDVTLSETERSKIAQKMVDVHQRQYRAQDELFKIEEERAKKEQERLKKEEAKLKKEAEDQKKKIESERKAAEEKAKQIAQARAEFELQFKIQKLEKDGKQEQADAIKNTLERNRLMKEYGYSIDEATRAVKALRDLEKQDEGKGKVSYSEKDVEKAKKLLERGESGSVGKKTLEQAQAIVEGRQIEGGELAIFSGASKRAKSAEKKTRFAPDSELQTSVPGAFQTAKEAISKSSPTSPKANAPKGGSSQSEVLQQILTAVNSIPATIKEVFA